MRSILSFSLCLILLAPALTWADGFAPKTDLFVGEEMPAMDISNKIGTQLPLDAPLVDEQGEPITLAQAMNGKPTVLVFAYFHCPQLCNQVLNHLVSRMRDLEVNLGSDYQVVTISIDPKDTAITAWNWRKQYTKQYGREGAEQGWRFLTAKEDSINRLTQSAGFVYTEVSKPLFQPVGSDRKNKEYAHPAAVIILQPEGTISRYLLGLNWNAAQLKYALIDGNSELGDLTDKVVMRCFLSFDHAQGRYTMDVWKLIRVVGIFTLLVLAVFVTRAVMKGTRPVPPELQDATPVAPTPNPSA